jgi:hypothetical protein
MLIVLFIHGEMQFAVGYKLQHAFYFSSWHHVTLSDMGGSSFGLRKPTLHLMPCFSTII